MQTGVNTGVSSAWRRWSLVLLSLLLPPASGADDSTPAADPHPLTDSEGAEITQQYQTVLEKLPAPEAGDADAISVHSRRGDALFFLRRFPEAVQEYEAMVRLDEALDASHWRLGIALFFADQPEQAVRQFEKYHSFDDVDRENGIWRYLSQYRATDGKTAQKELLRYEKDDREPFPAVYRLFDGSLTPEAALAAVPEQLSQPEREKRLFYTELYIGMHMVVRKQPDQAKKYLALAVSRQWPRGSGFGPNYMWHVGRVQLEELLRARTSASTEPE